MQVPVGLAEEHEVCLGYTRIKRIVGRIHQSAAFDDQIILLEAIGTPSIAPNPNRNIMLRQELHIASTIPLKTADKADIGAQPGPLTINECLLPVMIRIKSLVGRDDPARAEIWLFLRIGVIGLGGKDHIVILQAAHIAQVRLDQPYMSSSLYEAMMASGQRVRRRHKTLGPIMSPFAIQISSGVSLETSRKSLSFAPSQSG